MKKNKFSRILLSGINRINRFFKHQKAKRIINSLIKEKSEIWIEVGAGDKKGENGWITIDITPNCDIFWDLRNGLPFPDNSVSKIYSSHFLEHLSFKEGQSFLHECIRVLVPKGTFSICIPNARLYLEAYVNSLPFDHFCRYKPAFNNTTKIDYVNYIAYMDEHHKYMFDKENLLFILKSAGFVKAHIRDFDPDLDRKERDYESIYGVAEK